MNLQSILSQYLGGGSGAAMPADEHFGQVASALPTETVAQGLADAFRSDRTPPLGDIVGQLFGRSDPQQRAGLLNQVLAALGPAASGAVLSRVLGGAQSALGQAGVTPQTAATVTPEQAGAIAAHAEQHDPGVVDAIGRFYAQHPQLVQALGTAALSVAMSKIAQRTRG
jgi:hypothetical protein